MLQLIAVLFLLVGLWAIYPLDIERQALAILCFTIWAGIQVRIY